MNQGRIWLVVKPTVGLPLFLGGVAAIAVLVHSAILTHTDWFPAYYNGHQKAKPVAAAPVASPTVATVTPPQRGT
jgi:light-harvesting protein B-800-850 alpha chain